MVVKRVDQLNIGDRVEVLGGELLEVKQVSVELDDSWWLWLGDLGPFYFQEDDEVSVHEAVEGSQEG